MCFSQPKLPPKPEPPKREDPEIQKRKSEEARKNREQQGRRATILTSMMGVEDYGTKGRRATKLGQAA